jgi:DNA polymerase III delta subunit
LTLPQLKQQIKDGEFDDWYIFTGEEHEVLNIYIDHIANKSGAKKVYVDDLSSIFSKSRQSSLVKIKTLYVIIDDKDFLTNEKAWKALQRKSPFNDDIVIFYYTSRDKRNKFWKQFADRVVEFEHLDKRLLTKYIRKDLDLSDRNCEELIDICENDYGRILLEIDKIKRYQLSAEEDGEYGTFDEVFDILSRNGTIYKPPKDAIFDFVNAVLDRDVDLAYDLLEQSYAVGEANMVLISVLYNSFKNLMLVQTRRNKEDIGLNGWQIKNVSSYVDNYSTGELIRAMKILRKIEVGIKRGEIPDDISVNYFLVEVI